MIHLRFRSVCEPCILLKLFTLIMLQKTSFDALDSKLIEQTFYYN